MTETKLIRERLEEVEAENKRLKSRLREKEREVQTLSKEIEEIETEYADEIVRLQDRCILAKALVNIPDSLQECVRELIKERLKAFANLAYNDSGLDWLDSRETPCVRVDLEEAFTRKDRPKVGGRKRAK